MVAIGSKAPDFKLIGDDMKEHSLKDFKGKILVLYFYPKDDTPGCTTEAKTFNGSLKKFNAVGATVVGISKDSIESHCNFRDKYLLNFLLLSDPSAKVQKEYGAYGDRGIFGLGTLRNTYIIDKNGIILKIFEKVSPDKNPQEVLEAIRELNNKS
jgi:peroxiredoxin Q/BCP